MCSALFLHYSFSLNILWKNVHPLQLSPFPHHLFLFPCLCFFPPFPLSLLKRCSDFWLPRVAPELQVRRLEVPELSVAVEGDSPWWNINMSPYTILSKLGNVRVHGCSFRPLWWQKTWIETRNAAGFHCTIRKWIIILSCKGREQ